MNVSHNYDPAFINVKRLFTVNVNSNRRRHNNRILGYPGDCLLTQNNFNSLTGSEKGRKKKRNASLLLKHGSTAQMEDVIEQIHS